MALGVMAAAASWIMVPPSPAAALLTFQAPLTPDRRAFLVSTEVSQRFRRHFNLRDDDDSSTLLFASPSSTSSSSLSSLTVKELRQLVRESSAIERGVLSRLKKKQDLINFLEDHASSSSPKQQPCTSTARPRRKQPTVMPPLSSAPPRQAISSEASSSPKDAIFERVYQRYPPVRDQLTTTTTSPSVDENAAATATATATTVDVRQVYHPMLRQLEQPNDNDNDDDSSSSAVVKKKTSDMDLIFVGTASCTPGLTRGVSCTALRLNWNRRASFLDPRTGRQQEQASSFQGGTWIFDVGECTQLQVQRSPAIKPSKITKIFLTHAHGDHTFGLPGLLCLMGQDRDKETAPPVEIYGPQGLRLWLRVAIRYSVSRIVPPYRVHEIMNVPMAPEWEYGGRARRYFFNPRSNSSSGGGGRIMGKKNKQQQPQQQHRGSGVSGSRGRAHNNKQQQPLRWPKKGLAGEDPTSWISQAHQIHLEPSPLYGEIDGGRDIYPIYDHPRSADGAPVWQVEDEDDVRVYAAPMSHGIPCLGYVVEELPRPGRLRNELVEPIVRRNLQALKDAGFSIPMKAMAVIKNLPVGSAFTFPDGTVVTQSEAVEPPRRGRKVVICGDTADSRALHGLAQNADVIVHECTNAYLQGVDNKDTNLRAVTRDAVVHGHSTPQIAGEFCRAVKGKRLVLNHFSARYKGDASVDSLSIMMRIEYQAMKAAGLKETQVAAAWDMMSLPIPQHES